THPIGGKGVAKAPMASETPAIAKARASHFLENLRVSEDGVLTLVGCSLGSSGGFISPPLIVVAPFPTNTPSRRLLYGICRMTAGHSRKPCFSFQRAA